MSEKKWMILALRRDLWWRANGAGYTEHVDEAGQYTGEEALAIAERMNFAPYADDQVKLVPVGEEWTSGGDLKEPSTDQGLRNHLRAELFSEARRTLFGMDASGTPSLNSLHLMRTMMAAKGDAWLAQLGQRVQNFRRHLTNGVVVRTLLAEELAAKSALLEATVEVWNDELDTLYSSAAKDDALQAHRERAPEGARQHDYLAGWLDRGAIGGSK